MKEIKITKGLVTFVDDSDYVGLSQLNWSATSCNSKIYAHRKAPGNKTIYMHRAITGAKKGQSVDHINGDCLDNQRCNLRVCTHKQNIQNQRVQVRTKTSKYKGVFWVKQKARWFAAIKVNGKKHHLGTFVDEDKAAAAYNDAAIKYFGEFARTNKI